MTAAVLALGAPLRALRSPVAVIPPLDALVASGAIGERERVAGLAYAALRRRWERAELDGYRSVAAMTSSAYAALKRRHDALLEAAGFERFLLDRLLLDGEVPLRCEVERVLGALGRVAGLLLRVSPRPRGV